MFALKLGIIQETGYHNVLPHTGGSGQCNNVEQNTKKYNDWIGGK